MLVATKFELGGMALTTANTRVATASALTTTTALYGVTAGHTAVVPASVKTGVMVVLVVGAMVNSIYVLMAEMVLEALVDMLALNPVLLTGATVAVREVVQFASTKLCLMPRVS